MFQCCYLVDGEIGESTTSTENDGAGHHGSLQEEDIVRETERQTERETERETV